MSRRQQVQECASDFLCQSSECCRKYRFPVVAAMLKNISMFKMTNFWNDNDDDDSSQGLASDDDAEQNDSKKLGKSIIFCLDRAFLTHFSLVSISVLHWKRALCERSVGKKMKSSSFSLAEKALKRNKKKKKKVCQCTHTDTVFLSFLSPSHWESLSLSAMRAHLSAAVRIDCTVPQPHPLIISCCVNCIIRCSITGW